MGFIVFQDGCLEKLGFDAKSYILNDHIPWKYNTQFSLDLSAGLINLQYYLQVADTRHTSLPQRLKYCKFVNINESCISNAAYLFLYFRCVNMSSSLWGM